MRKQNYTAKFFGGSIKFFICGDEFDIEFFSKGEINRIVNTNLFMGGEFYGR